MLKNFLQFVEENNLFNKSDVVLLAVSGGMDSVSMATLFHQAQFKFAIAHCNFNLRGDESDADEQFVKKLAKKFKVEIHTKQFDTLLFSEREKISVQMAARSLRYKWFQELLEKYNYSCVATAHHKNDNLETILLNLARGTGIAGFHGILPKNGKLIRPLLFADKDMIRDYVAEKQITWREDSSNESTKYSRNLIRHEVIPQLKKINPLLDNTIVHTIERVRSVENIFHKYVRSFEETATHRDGVDIYLNISKLKDEDEGKIILNEIIQPFNFNFSQSGDIFQALERGSGKIFESPTHKLNIDRDYVIISPKKLHSIESAEISSDIKSLEHENIHFNFSIHDVDELKITGDKNSAYLDLEKLSFPLNLRKWKHGDWFIPLGMSKKKKLSDFMIDEKIPLNLKERALVLVSGDSIVWLVGRRIDERFKITDKTEKAFKISCS